MLKMNSFFADKKSEVTFPISKENEKESYWSCQRGAYWALKSHQTTRNKEPAIISIPTGGGKTALMMLTAFEYEANRTLILAPSDSIRTQLKEKFECLEGLNKAKAISEEISNPDVEILDERPRDESDWNNYSGSDVLITLPNTICSKYTQEDEEEIASPPQDFFDLVLVDEAHHSSAPSWKEILSDFSDLPHILFTATPFRRDNDLLPGRLIYHYPVDKAVNDGIYHEVELEPYSEDKNLIDVAEKKLENFQETNDDAAMLVRTDSTNNADELAKDYNERDGLEVTAVHSKVDKKENEDAIRDLRSGEIDGVVIVDKFAEGIDINNIQLAVFHEPPKSLRMTIQLIGRLARQPPDGETAKIVATDGALSDNTTEETVRQLYYENTGWTEVVPDIIEEHIDPQRWPTRHTQNQSPAAVNEENIELYKTVTVYSIKDTDIDLTNKLEDCSWEIYPLKALNSSEFCGYITISNEKPTWGKKTILETQNFDLHLFYNPQNYDLLFEYTTNKKQASEMRNKLINSGDAPSQIDGQRLSKVMQSLQNPKYQTTGLSNTSIPSGNQPQYKTYYGEDVQGAVYHSDERTYTHGHVFATFESGGETETRGVSGDKSKIWSNSKESISQFRKWCNQMAKRLSNNSEPGIQNLESLDTGSVIDQFDSDPFSVIFDPRLAATPIEISGVQFTEPTVVKPSLKLESIPKQGSSSIDVVMRFENYDIEISCSYNVSKNQWSGKIADYDVTIPGRNKAPRSINGNNFLENYPPRFFTEEGTIIVNGQKQSSQADLSSFDPSEYKASTPIDWSEYISEGASEKPEWYKSENKGTFPSRWDSNQPSSVFEALVRWLKQNRDEDHHILFCDDEGGEVADFIELCTKEKEINFYHCKGSNSTGISLGRFKDIYQQTIRSLRFIASMRLIDHIDDRRTPGTLQHFVRGETKYDSVKQNFRPNEWEYTIYGVNPCLKTDFDPEAGTKYQNVGRLISECVEQVGQTGVESAIQGANDSW